MSYRKFEKSLNNNMYQYVIGLRTVDAVTGIGPRILDVTFDLLLPKYVNRQ
jgi:hypothetical protein